MQKSKKTCVSKNYIWDPSTCTYENGKYSGSIIDDETIEAKKTIPTKTISINNFFILLAFLLITISLLVIVSIYSHFIKIN